MREQWEESSPKCERNNEFVQLVQDAEANGRIGWTG